MGFFWVWADLRKKVDLFDFSYFKGKRKLFFQKKNCNPT